MGSAINSMFGGLDTSLKRPGFVIFVIGAVLAILATILFWQDTSRFNRIDIVEYWIRAIIFDASYSVSRTANCMAVTGFYIMLVTLVLTNFYDKTFGALLRWIVGK